MLSQPARKEKLGVAPSVVTHKDFKLGYDKIRLNTWCEEIKFTVITPNTFIEFDDLVIKFVTKSKHIALGSKLKDIKLDAGPAIKLPAPDNQAVRMTFNQSLTLTVLIRAQTQMPPTGKYFDDGLRIPEPVRDTNMVVTLLRAKEPVFKKYWALPELRHLFTIHSEMKGPFLILTFCVNPDSKHERVACFKNVHVTEKTSGKTLIKEDGFVGFSTLINPKDSAGGSS